MKKLLYFSIVSALVGSNVISINLGFFKLSLFRVAILLMLCLLVIELLVGTHKITVVIKKTNKYSISFMMFWFIYAILSVVWVKDYNGWIRSIYFLSLGLVCIVLFSKYFNSKKDIINSIKLISLVSLFHNAMGWYEIVTGDYIFVDPEIAYFFAKGKFPVSVFGNPNDFATFMLFVIFISFVSIANTNNQIIKNVYKINMLSSCALLFLSGSRANILGLFLGFIIFIFLSLTNHRTRRTVGGILILFFIVMLLFPDSSSLIRNELDFSSSYIVGSDNIRINLIKNGITFLLNTFLFGTGSGNSEYWMQHYSLYWTEGIYSIHNWWFEILVNYGLIVFVLYVIFYIKLFVSMLKKFKNSNSLNDKIVSLSFIACMSGYTLGSMSSSSNLNSEWLWVFWGIAISYQGMALERNEESI